jgi:hypothetical protein
VADRWYPKRNSHAPIIFLINNLTGDRVASLTSEDTSYRADIDGLRAFAVLAVIGFHFKISGFQGGFVGVDIFL